MSISKVQGGADSESLQVATVTVSKVRDEQQEEPKVSVHAMPLAGPQETIKAATQVANMMTAMMMPSPDGIFVIGSVAAKVANGLRSIGTRAWNSWGF
jgi:hypothetical protein